MDSNTGQGYKNLQIPLIESPFFNQISEGLSLSVEEREKIHSFEKNGLVVLDLTGEQFDKTCEEIVDVFPGYIERPDYSPDGNRVQDAWRFLDSVKSLAVLEVVLKWLRLFYQREPIPFQTLNFKGGTEQGMHCDTIHFHCLPHRFMVGVWVALEDVDDENGPLFYYPGSHKLPICDFFDIGLNACDKENLADPSSYYEKYSEYIRASVELHGFKKEILNLKKGNAVIWAANLVHGGMPIADKSRSRFSQVTHYYFENCMYYVPMYSVPYLGKYHYKEIVDVRNGKIVDHFFLNQRLSLDSDQNNQSFLNSLYSKFFSDA